MIKIYTETSADYPYEVNEITKLPLYYYFEDNPSIEYGDEINLTNKEFYDYMRSGKVPRTSSVNIAKTIELFKKELDKDNDIICLSLTSYMNSCYNNEVLASNYLKEEYPNRKIHVIDTKIGSLAQALLAIRAKYLSEHGYEFDDIINFIENNKLLYNFEIVVEDLIYPVRGGRVNSTVGSVGNKLNIKPLVKVDSNGKTFIGNMIRGSKKVEERLIKNGLSDGKENILELGIVHTDNLDRALEFKDKLNKLGLVEDIPVVEVGPPLGSHTGPGAIGLVTKKKVRRR